MIKYTNHTASGLFGVKKVFDVMTCATRGSYGYKFFAFDEDSKCIHDVTREVAFACGRRFFDFKTSSQAIIFDNIRFPSLNGEMENFKFDAASEVAHFSNEGVNEELNKCYDRLKSFGILTIEMSSILVTDMTKDF